MNLNNDKTDEGNIYYTDWPKHLTDMRSGQNTITKLTTYKH